MRKWRISIRLFTCSWMLFSLTAQSLILTPKNILMVTLAGTKSHKIPFMELAHGLALRGHNVTFTNAFPTDQSFPSLNIEEIHPLNLVMYVKNFTNWDLLGPKLKGEMPVPIVDIFRFGYQVCEAFLSDTQTEALLRRRFDLLILDGAYPECALGLAYYYKVPFVYINTVGFYTGSLSRAGNPAPYSVTPYMGLPYSDNMNIGQRLVNALFHIGLSSMHTIMVHGFLNPVVRKYLHPDTPSAYELSKNVSLIMQNGHFSVTYPRPYLPGVVEIACLHCRPSKALPKHLEEFVNGGQGKGFIYVSMGSSVRASNMPEDLRVLFLKVFRVLPYQILWKWEAVNAATMLDLPTNVMLSNWFPQQDLLGHPKIRGFITHGGLLSLFETVYHGVPVVAMPVFCDHDSNVQKAVMDGYAIRLELKDLTAGRLLQNINALINNPRYRERALSRSVLLKDQLDPPLKKAIYWTEYVLRHGGGHHLKSPSRNMSVVSYYSLDITVIFVALLVLLFYFVKFSFKFLSRLLAYRCRIKIKIN